MSHFVSTLISTTPAISTTYKISLYTFRFYALKWDGKGVEIMLGGDTELETFIEALRWAADNLEKLTKEKQHLIIHKN